MKANTTNTLNAALTGQPDGSSQTKKSATRFSIKWQTVTLLIAGSIGIGALVLFYLNPASILYFTIGWILVISVLLWIGNQQLTERLGKVMPWEKYGNWRFFVQLVLGLLFLLVLINVSYVILKIIINSAPSVEQITVMNVWGAAIFIPLYSLYFSLQFLRHWRLSVVQVARHQKESMRAQLDSLKNHLDPHFLFNNLNILAALIDKDKQASKLFIEKFAEVYRTMLQAKSGDLIPLRQELAFIEAYMFLLETRFENLIQFKCNVGASAQALQLPPLTLQMLVENVVKHNGISEKEPLVIEVTEQLGNMLSVRNNRITKRHAVEGNSGTGLENIRQRFAYFTSNPVRIEESATHFEVLVPLLTLETT